MHIIWASQRDKEAKQILQTIDASSSSFAYPFERISRTAQSLDHFRDLSWHFEINLRQVRMPIAHDNLWTDTFCHFWLDSHALS